MLLLRQKLSNFVPPFGKLNNLVQQVNNDFNDSIYFIGWVYPPVSHWAWDSHGWLNQLE